MSLRYPHSKGECIGCDGDRARDHARERGARGRALTVTVLVVLACAAGLFVVTR